MLEMPIEKTKKNNKFWKKMKPILKEWNKLMKKDKHLTK